MSIAGLVGPLFPPQRGWSVGGRDVFVLGVLAVCLGIANLASVPVLRRFGLPLIVGLALGVLLAVRWADLRGGSASPVVAVKLLQVQYGFWVSSGGAVLAVLGGALIHVDARGSNKPSASSASSSLANGQPSTIS